MASLIIDNGAPKAASMPTTLGLAIESRDLWEEVQAALRGIPVRVLIEERDLQNWKAFRERLESLRPNVVLTDITQPPQPLEEYVRGIRSSAPDAMLIALHRAADPQTILTSIRAGANEFLYPPLEDSLRKALERQSEERSRSKDNSRPPGKVLGFLSAKGGCGATTIACHLASELGRLSTQRAEPSLLADFDLDAGIVGFLMKVKSPYSIVDAVQNLHRLDVSYWHALVSNEWPGLEIIVAPNGSLAKEPASGEALRQVLAFARSVYGWTVADLGCTLNVATLTVLDEVDEIYLVTTLEVPSLHRAKQAVQVLMNAGYAQRVHVILNRTPQRPDVTGEELERILGLPIDMMLPNDYYALYDAFCKGKLLPSGSHLGRKFTELATRLAGVPVEKSKRRFGLFG